MRVMTEQELIAHGLEVREAQSLITLLNAPSPPQQVNA